jgi:hypothetical protein
MNRQLQNAIGLNSEHLSSSTYPRCMPLMIFRIQQQARQTHGISSHHHASHSPAASESQRYIGHGAAIIVSTPQSTWICVNLDVGQTSHTSHPQERSVCHDWCIYDCDSRISSSKKKHSHQFSPSMSLFDFLLDFTILDLQCEKQAYPGYWL